MPESASYSVPGGFGERSNAIGYDRWTYAASGAFDGDNGLSAQIPRDAVDNQDFLARGR